MKLRAMDDNALIGILIFLIVLILAIVMIGFFLSMLFIVLIAAGIIIVMSVIIKHVPMPHKLYGVIGCLVGLIVLFLAFSQGWLEMMVI